MSIIFAGILNQWLFPFKVYKIILAIAIAVEQWDEIVQFP